MTESVKLAFKGPCQSTHNVTRVVVTLCVKHLFNHGNKKKLGVGLKKTI